MQSSLEILQDRLITPVGYPTLLLGAGFSLGATNVDGLGMPLGKQFLVLVVLCYTVHSMILHWMFFV